MSDSNPRTRAFLTARFPGLTIKDFEATDIGPGLIVVNSDDRVVAYGNDIDDDPGQFHLVTAYTPNHHGDLDLDDIKALYGEGK